MEVSILSDSENKNVGRREVSFSVVQDGKTASKEQIKQELCKKLSLNPDSTIITEIKQEFGMRRSAGMAHSYSSKEQLERSEPGYLMKRLSKGEKKEGAEHQKEERPKETGKGQVKEEKKKVEKKVAKEEKPKEEAKEEEKKE